jgi:hypothetical protein
MACPFFYAIEPASRHPLRPVPLGDWYGGECRARSGEFRPTDPALLTLCNLGYARGECPRFPEGAAADAVRFALAADGPILSIRFAVERQHQPREHGVLEYSVAARRLAAPHRDPVLTRLAEAYAEAYLRRKDRCAQESHGRKTGT